MWPAFATGFFVMLLSSIDSENTSMFRKEQIIFSSSYNITQILVPADGNRYIHAESSDLPSIFFTISDPKLEGGSCIYVLEDLAAYEIMEGGRDSTADYSSDRTVYFGAQDGLYKYDHASLSAKKLGPFRDDIKQLQKANGTDKIYILNQQNKLFVLENHGTVKTKVKDVVCATEFVLDTSNNIYFVECGTRMIHIIRNDGFGHSLSGSIVDEFDNIKLLRPAFIMDACIPFLGDGVLHILHANGTNEKRDLELVERPSALSVDAALYLVAALNGKIYEFNVMEYMIHSMLGGNTVSSSDVSSIIMSVIENAKDGLFGFHKGWYQNN